MFILESKTARAARKMSVLMAIAFVLTASFGLLLTMHIYVRSSRAAPRGFRILGFPRPTLGG
jgi:hypothetical protein